MRRFVLPILAACSLLVACAEKPTGNVAGGALLPPTAAAADPAPVAASNVVPTAEQVPTPYVIQRAKAPTTQSPQLNQPAKHNQGPAGRKRRNHRFISICNGFTLSERHQRYRYRSPFQDLGHLYPSLRFRHKQTAQATPQSATNGSIRMLWNIRKSLAMGNLHFETRSSLLAAGALTKRGLFQCR